MQTTFWVGPAAVDPVAASRPDRGAGHKVHPSVEALLVRRDE
jgi:hypothetical protein